MVMEWFGIVAILLSFICLSMLTIVYLYIKRQLLENERFIGHLKKDFNVVCASASRASNRVVHLEKQLKKLLDRQDQIEMRDPLNHSYGQAIAMAKKGMGIEELVNILGIPRGEAELITLMHRVKKVSNA